MLFKNYYYLQVLDKHGVADYYSEFLLAEANGHQEIVSKWSRVSRSSREVLFTNHRTVWEIVSVSFVIRGESHGTFKISFILVIWCKTRYIQWML